MVSIDDEKATMVMFSRRFKMEGGGGRGVIQPCDRRLNDGSRTNGRVVGDRGQNVVPH